MNSKENVDTLTYLKSLVDAGYTQPNPATTDRTSGAWALFGGQGRHGQRRHLPAGRHEGPGST